MKISQAIAKYIELRDQRDDLKKQQADEIKTRFTDPMNQLEAAMLKYFNAKGCDSAKSKGVGTAYIGERLTVKIVDRKAFLDWVEEEGSLDFLDIKASKSAVSEYIEKHDGDLPPGINCTTDRYVNFRRSN